MAAFDISAREFECRMFESEIASVLSKFKVPSLKDEQCTMLSCLLNKKDCLAALPTGFGKSLPYQILPSLIREVTKQQQHYDWLNTHAVSPKVIICSPLISLMSDQVNRLRAAGCTAGFIGESVTVDNEIEIGNVDFIFGSPESLVGNARWRNCVKNFHTAISAVVVDECHTVAVWGGLGGDDIQAFRKWFSNIGELRSLTPKSSVMALSATTTKAIQKRVCEVLGLEKNKYQLISRSPDQTKLKYVAVKVDYGIEAAFYWMVDALQSDLENFPRTLVYCTSIAHVASLYGYMLTELKGHEKNIEMYHSETPDEKKQYMLKDLCGKGHLKVVICTSALGMGIDIKNCHTVVHYGPPSTTVDYLQETGRVGRDGALSMSILLYNGHLMRSTDLEMKSFIKEEKCRRTALLRHFISQGEIRKLEARLPSHSCCDLCAKKCECSNCEAMELEDYLPRHNTIDVIKGKDSSNTESSDSETSVYLSSALSDKSDNSDPTND